VVVVEVFEGHQKGTLSNDETIHMEVSEDDDLDDDDSGEDWGFTTDDDSDDEGS
jgi:hypothetical protein